MPTAPLRLLMVEDSPDDAGLALAFLQSGGFSVTSTCVETQAEMLSALTTDTWDLVLSDYNLPAFSAAEALKTLNASGCVLPFIVCSGFVGEELAVELIKSGATDFVAKDNMRRLAAVVERALRELEVARQHRDSRIALEQSEARFSALVANIPGVVFQATCTPDGRFQIIYISRECQALCGLTAETLIEDPARLIDMIVPEDRPTFHRSRKKSRWRQHAQNWVGRLRLPETGEIKWVNVRASVRALPSGDILSEGIINNITQSKQVEIELLRSHEALRELSSHLQQAKERERADIAREIHDDLGGTLTAAKIDLLGLMRKLPPMATDQLEKAGSIEVLLDQATDISRRISRRLRPGVLDYGIAAAIEWQSRDFEKRMDIECKLTCSDDDLQLSPHLSTALFRIFQEALTNIAKHSRAKQVCVSLTVEGGRVRLCVADDGRGMQEADLAKAGSFGILGMRERVEHYGGDFRVCGRAQGGTELEVSIPTQAAETPDPLAQSTGLDPVGPQPSLFRP